MAPTSARELLAEAERKEAEVLSAFLKYDIDGSHTIDRTELESLLADLGVDSSAGIAALAKGGGPVAAALSKAGAGKGGLSFEDLKAVWNALQDLRTAAMRAARAEKSREAGGPFPPQ